MGERADQLPAAGSTAFAQVAAQLQGRIDPLGNPSVGTCAGYLRQAADCLRMKEEPFARHVAAAFDRWLRDGGDLSQYLGIKAGRGKWREQPARNAMKTRQREVLVSVVRELPEDERHRNAAAALLALARAGDSRLAGISMPTSASQIRRILKTR